MHKETAFAVAAKLIIGSAFYVFSRLIMKTCGEPSYDFDVASAASNYANKYCPKGQTAFGKGIFLMMMGWAAMATALVYFYFFRRTKAVPTSFGRRAIMLVALPSAIDMISTALSTFATPWISLSLAFIFKGGRVVFSAILTVALLKRKLYPYHWASVVLCMVGLVVCASSQLLTEPSAFLGVLLIVGAELFKALRVVIEERMMKHDSFEPTFLVGVEGAYGVGVFGTALLVAWLAIGGSDGGSFENLPDTMHRISDSPTLIALLCAFVPLTCIASITSAVVTRNLSAVHNGLISVVRVGILWVFELVLFYAFSGASIGKQLGEPWTPYSWLKLTGFGIVLFSTLVYDEDVRIPCFFSYSHLTPPMPDKEQVMS